MTKALFHLRQFRLLLLFLLCALFSLPLSAQEGYVLEREGGSTLTFYYDNYRDSRNGKTWRIDEYDSIPAWAGTYNSPNERTKKVVFDSSFKNYRPTSTARWFARFKSLYSIEGLENLNTSEVTDMSEMFDDCSILTSLDVFDFKTSKVTNMSKMFNGCSRLSSLNLSKFNTSKVTNMSKMFNGCSGLNYLNVNNFNTSAVTDMREMFFGCSGLTELYLSNFNTSAVTNMSAMFSGCSRLTELNLSNFNTSAVKDMSDMFRECSGLRTLNVSNFNTSAVTDMRWMFYNCSGLEELNVSNFNTSKVTGMREMFSGCSGLKELNLSNFNTSKVTDMSEMFSGCSRLEKILNTNIWRCEQSQDMFKGCIRLRGAVKFDASKVDVKMANPEAGYFFDPNKKVAYVQQSKDDHILTFYYDANRAFRSGKTWRIDEKKHNNSNNNETVPAWAGTPGSHYEQRKKVVFDASFKDYRPTTTNSWFSYLTSLTTIEGLENLNTSAVSDMSGMFSGCDLTSLSLSNFNTSAVTNMSGMFSGCRELKELNVSNFNTSAVTDMSGMFEDCRYLKELNVSNFNTSAVTNMSEMFKNCLSLKRIFNANTWRCEQSQDMFKGCTRLKGAVKYDESKVDVTMANLTTGYFTNSNGKEAYVLESKDSHTLTFYYDNNRKLHSDTTWDIDDDSNMSRPVWTNSWVTKVVFDASFKDFRPTTTEDWFYQLSKLTTIEGLENLNTSAVTNMRRMFFGCSSLTSLNLSNFNTSAVTDMSEMFSGCSDLKTIFNTQTWRCEQSQDMFYGCTQLRGAVKYDESKVDVTMANFETGYFRDPNKKYLDAYVLQSEDQHTLTFYYDNNRKLRSGKIWDIDVKSSSSVPAWAGTNESSNNVVTKVVFDASFKDFLPFTTNSWFSHLKALTTIEGLENLNTSAVTNMSEMFSGCRELKELNVSNFNTSAVTNMSRMFSGCYGLKELNVSSFNTSEVTDMSVMFSGCSGLTSLNVSNFKTSAVTDMSNMFSGCSGLTSLNLSNFNTSEVTDMGGMFSGCSGLKTIFNTQTWRCEQSQDMFYGCTQLRGAVKYDSRKVDVTMANFETGYFRNPNKKYLEAYVLQSEDQHTLTFYYDNNLKLRSGEIWDIDEKSSSSEPAWAGSYYSPNNVVTKVVFDASFKDFRPTTTNSWFSYLKALTTIEGLENLNTSKVTDMSKMFYNCSSLRSLNLSNFNTSAVTNMSEMFYGCSGLTELNVSSFNTSAVTDMSYMFSKCSSLTSLNLSNFNTSAVTNMNYIFSGCSSLTSLNLSNFNTSAVTRMGGMFEGCSGLKELNVSNFNTSKVRYMWGMFSRCSGLTSLNLSNFNTSKVTDMSEMFYGCSSLKTILNPNTWRCEQAQDMFKGCTQLRGAVKYSYNKVGDWMANPATGYFTDLNSRAYVLQGEDQHTLTFYYDNNRYSRSSKTWDINQKSWDIPVWAGTKEDPNNVVTKVVFDASFKDFRPTTTKSWFYDLSELTTIEGLENLNTSTVTDMTRMFSGCSGLKELNVSNFNTSAVKDMSGMFYRCSSLTELNVSNFNTSAVKDMNWMFSGCSSLKTILNPNTWRCEKSQDMFKGCTQLKGAVKYDENAVYDMMANPTTGYFSRKLPTAIGRVVFDDNNATQIYNLQGKRVNANQRHLPAGFYIVNGKKVYLNEKP